MIRWIVPDFERNTGCLTMLASRGHVSFLEATSLQYYSVVCYSGLLFDRDSCSTFPSPHYLLLVSISQAEYSINRGGNIWCHKSK
jgi:hypothetical protein